MSAWTNDQLTRIGDADELQISSARPDGSLRNPVTIWVVRHGDDVFVRSYKGPAAGWYRGTRLSPEGHIHAGGIDADVTFTDVTDDGLQTEIDAAYRSKYGHYDAQYVDPMLAAPAHAATLQLTPR